MLSLTDLFVFKLKSFTMPLFSNKFSPKKTRARKSVLSLNTEGQIEDLFNENRVIKLRLGDQESRFENGDWVPASGSGGNTHKSNQKLRQRLHEVEEENNLLKLKLEILLNMLTQATAESHLQQREIDKLQRMDSKTTKLN